jgi:hypothetical protein
VPCDSEADPENVLRTRHAHTLATVPQFEAWPNAVRRTNSARTQTRSPDGKRATSSSPTRSNSVPPPARQGNGHATGKPPTRGAAPPCWVSPVGGMRRQAAAATAHAAPIAAPTTIDRTNKAEGEQLDPPRTAHTQHTAPAQPSNRCGCWASIAASRQVLAAAARSSSSAPAPLPLPQSHSWWTRGSSLRPHLLPGVGRRAAIVLPLRPPDCPPYPCGLCLQLRRLNGGAGSFCRAAGPSHQPRQIGQPGRLQPPLRPPLILPPSPPAQPEYQRAPSGPTLKTT